MKQPAKEQMLIEAFEALPDAVYLFGDDRRLLKSNEAGAQLQSGELLKGTPCCEMFWHVDDPDGCVVDRALQSREGLPMKFMHWTNRAE